MAENPLPKAFEKALEQMRTLLQRAPTDLPRLQEVKDAFSADMRNTEDGLSQLRQTLARAAPVPKPPPPPPAPPPAPAASEIAVAPPAPEKPDDPDWMVVLRDQVLREFGPMPADRPDDPWVAH
jgi:hypothetical protein